MWRPAERLTWQLFIVELKMFHPDSAPRDNRKSCEPITTAVQRQFHNESENPLDRTSIFIKQLGLIIKGKERSCKKCHQSDLLVNPLHQQKTYSSSPRHHIYPDRGHCCSWTNGDGKHSIIKIEAWKWRDSSGHNTMKELSRIITLHL